MNAMRTALPFGVFVCLSVASADARAEDPPGPRPELEKTNAAWIELHRTHECARPDVLCLHGDGTPLPADDRPTRDALPKNVTQGTMLTIKVIGCAAAYPEVKFEIGLESTGSADQLFRVEFPAEGGDSLLEKRGNRAAVNCKDPKAHYSVLSSAKIQVPGKPGGVAVTFERHASPGIPALTASYSAKVIRGLYFLDIGFAAPFVLGGKRKITAVRDPDLDLDRLRLDQDLLIKPAVMLNVFPWGRRLGALTSFARDRDCNGLGILDRRRCRGHNFARGLGNSFGLQLGLSFDVEEDFGSEFYMGGMFEPVVGLNFGFGLALVRTEFFRDGFTDGQLVGPDIAASEYMVERMAPRPYFSISFSLDIIRNVRAALARDEVTSIGGREGK